MRGHRAHLYVCRADVHGSSSHVGSVDISSWANACSSKADTPAGGRALLHSLACMLHSEAQGTVQSAADATCDGDVGGREVAGAVQGAGMQVGSGDGSGSLHDAASDGGALGSQAAPVPSIEWEYEGRREELHGVQRALVGAIVTDDVFGAAILQGEASGELVLSIEGETRRRTSGHVYYALKQDQACPAIEHEAHAAAQ